MKKLTLPLLLTALSVNVIASDKESSHQETGNNTSPPRQRFLTAPLERVKTIPPQADSHVTEDTVEPFTQADMPKFLPIDSDAEDSVFEPRPKKSKLKKRMSVASSEASSEKKCPPNSTEIKPFPSTRELMPVSLNGSEMSILVLPPSLTQENDKKLKDKVLSFTSLHVGLREQD